MEQENEEHRPDRKLRTREHVIEGFLMARENQDELTILRLQKFLIGLGFDQPVKIENALGFHHAESGTLVMVTIPDDGKSLRSADLLSILVRLENQGLACPSILEQFKAGKLPMAS